MPVTGTALRLEHELSARLAMIDDETVRELVKAWAIAWDEVAPDLTATMAEMLASPDGVTRAQLLRSMRLRKSLQAIEKSLTELTQQAGIRITGQLQDVIDDAGKTQAKIIAAQGPARSHLTKDLDAWSRVDDRQINAIVRRTTQHVTSALKPLSAQASDVVRRELIRGVAAGSNPKQTARRMVARAEEGFNGGLSRALTIARTETLDAHRAAAALAQQEQSDVLTGWIWSATLTARTCPACWGMNGTVHELDEPGPMGHQNCRCARIPALKPWSDLGFDVEEPPSDLPDPDDQFAKLTPAEQRRVLGPRGYEAWKQGKFPRSQWAKRQKNPGWRDSFVPARPPKVKIPATASPSGASGGKSKKAAAKKTAASPVDPLKGAPKINPQLLANMKRRGIDLIEWNRRATNPNHGTDPSYGINCQRVVQAYEVRRRGYDVTAKPNADPNDGSGRADVFMKWLDGAEQRTIDSGRYLVSPQTLRILAQQAPAAATFMVSDAEKYVRDTVAAWPVGARGWVTFYRDAGAGHIFNIERTATGVQVVEAQVPNGGELATLSHYMGQVRMLRRRNGRLQLNGHSLFVTRVDDLHFNSGVLEAVTWT